MDDFLLAGHGGTDECYKERKKKATKRELKSLTGQLQHVATIIKPGRTFLRRMYDMFSLAKLPQHHIRLNEDFKSDLAWWSMFLSSVTI